jgi:hypothetical protein
MILNGAPIVPSEALNSNIWIWDSAREVSDFGANMDYLASSPADGLEQFSRVPVDNKLHPVYRTQNALRRFRKLHSPPFIGGVPIVDQLWQDIILKFVPHDRIQFLPVQLIARGETCDDYCCMIAFDRVRVVDLEKSDITRKIEKPGITYVFGIKNIILKDDGLNGFHVARDEQTKHLLVSNALKMALSDTGQDSVFYTAKEISSNLFNF